MLTHGSSGCHAMSLEDCGLMVVCGAENVIYYKSPMDISNQGRLVDCNQRYFNLLITYVFDKTNLALDRPSLALFPTVSASQNFLQSGQVHPRRPAYCSNIPIINRNAQLVLHLLCRKWSLLTWKLCLKRSILVFAMVSYLPQISPTIHRLILGGV